MGDSSEERFFIFFFFSGFLFVMPRENERFGKRDHGAKFIYCRRGRMVWVSRGFGCDSGESPRFGNIFQVAMGSVYFNECFCSDDRIVYQLNLRLKIFSSA